MLYNIIKLLIFILPLNDEEEAGSESEGEPNEHQPNQTGIGKTVKLADSKGIC